MNALNERKKGSENVGKSIAREAKMSDSDDDSPSLGAAKYDCIFFAMEAKNKVDAGTILEYKKGAGGAQVAHSGMYAEPTDEMVAHNVKLLKGSNVNEALAYSNGLVNVGGVFEGCVDDKNALNTYCGAMQYHSQKDCALEVKRIFMKKEEVTILQGIRGYPTHLGAHNDAAQKKVMTGLPGTFIKNTSKKMWPELHAIYAEVQEKVGDSFHLQLGHLLFGWDKHTCFEFHQDTKETSKKPVHMTVVVELGMSQSSFAVAGHQNDSMQYQSAGSFYAMDSNLWHRSDESYSNTIKLALFFTFAVPKASPNKVKEEVKGEEEDPKASPNKVKAEVKGEEEDPEDPKEDTKQVEPSDWSPESEVVVVPSPFKVKAEVKEEEEGAEEEDAEDSKKVENDDTEKVDPSADVAEVDPPAEAAASSSHAGKSSPHKVKKEKEEEAVPRGKAVTGKRSRRGL